MLGYIVVCFFYFLFEEFFLINVSCVFEIFLLLVCIVNCNIFLKVKEMYLFYVNIVVLFCRLFYVMLFVFGLIFFCIFNVLFVQERFKLQIKFMYFGVVVDSYVDLDLYSFWNYEMLLKYNIVWIIN